jgi:hypothetical protein
VQSPCNCVFKNVFVLIYWRLKGEERNVYRVLVAKPEGKRPLGSRRWEGGIKMDLRVMAEGVQIGFIWLKMRIVGGLL